MSDEKKGNRNVRSFQKRGFIDKDIREFKIDSSGIVILKKFEGQEGIMTGRPTRAVGSFDELLKKMGELVDC
jgi:hypothetical protein